MEAVRIREVTKYYKKFADKHKFLTIKSALVNKTLFSDLMSNERFEALKGVSFDVPTGKTYGIIGENGSGKSTLLKIMAGIAQPTSGQVETVGRISALIELGAGFHPEISGRENILINGIILGLTKKQIQEKTDEIIRFAELEEFIENPVKTYSSGMFMRLGFSIAINVDPDILLIDEVLSVGDASFVPRCLDKINEFRRRGKTIVFVSHDLATVERICDEVIWMKNGLVEMQGYPKRVVDAYLEYVGKKEESRSLERHAAEEEEGRSSMEKRWGSGEIRIENVRMFGREGKESYVFETGDPLEIEFDVQAEIDEEDFVFGLAIFSNDGTLCYGTNTSLERFSPKRIQGSGRVRIRIPRLDLNGGFYFLDLAVHKRDGFPFDYHHFQYSFRVVTITQMVGMIHVEHEWVFSGGIQIDPS